MPEHPPRFLTEPTAVIAEIVLDLEPELAPDAVAEAIASAAKFKSRHRKLAEALTTDPDLLISGRPEGPVAIQKLIRALQAAGGKRVVLPRCAHCGKRHRLPSLDGDQRICAYCRMRMAAAENPCVICGRTAHIASRDHLGRPRCVLHPDHDQDSLALVCEHVVALDPGITREEVAAAVRAAAQMPAHQRQLAWALTDNPRLLTGEGAKGPHKLILLIEELLARDAQNIVLPPCPFCGTDRKLRHTLDGQRACRACYEKLRLLPCSRCGRIKAVATRTVDGQPLCHPCSRADPVNHEPCARCGRVANVVRRIGDMPFCGRCFRPPRAICSVCGRSRPCYFAATDEPRCETCSGRLRPPQPCSRCGHERVVRTRLPDGQPLCGGCSQVEEPCLVCGKTKLVLGRDTAGKPLCRVCYGKHPTARRICVQCGVLDRLYRHGLCNSCALARQLTGLLGDMNGAIRPDLDPVFQCLRRGEPLPLLYWLQQPVPRQLLSDLASAPGPVTHYLLDGLRPFRAVQHLRAALVADGVLPPRDEHLAALERWLTHVLARIEDPGERQVVRSFATWHHLRRLRSKAVAGPVTRHRTVGVRREVKAAIELVTWLRARGTTLETCTQHDIDDWLATDLWLRYLARSFLLWAVRRQHAHQVEIPIPPRNTSMQLIEQDQRWAHVRRLVHDDEIDTVTRVAGLLLLLFAQPLSRISLIRVDQVTRTANDVSLALGSTPSVLPPPLDDLVMTLVQRRHGRSVLGRSDDHSWLFPGAGGRQPISSQQLMHRLTELDIRARPARNTTLMELSAELPAVVLSRLLGLAISRAEKWAKEAGSTRAEYAAELSRRPR